MQHATTTLASLALATLLTLGGCTLTTKGGLDTPDGAMELADLCDIAQAGCTEGARAAGEKDAGRIESAMTLLHQALVGKATLAEVQSDLRTLGLSSAWSARIATVYSIASRRLQRLVTVDNDVVRIADAVVASCRAGIAVANQTAMFEHCPVWAAS